MNENRISRVAPPIVFPGRLFLFYKLMVCWDEGKRTSGSCLFPPFHIKVSIQGIAPFHISNLHKTIIGQVSLVLFFFSVFGMVYFVFHFIYFQFLVILIVYFHFFRFFCFILFQKLLPELKNMFKIYISNSMNVQKNSIFLKCVYVFINIHIFTKKFCLFL